MRNDRGHRVVHVGDHHPRREPGVRIRARHVGRDRGIGAVADDGDHVRRAGRALDERIVHGCHRQRAGNAGADQRAVAVGVGSDHVQAGAAVQVLVCVPGVGADFGEAVVVEGAIVGSPRGAAVVGAIDDLRPLVPRGDVEDVDDALLRASGRDSVGDARSVRRRLEVDCKVMSGRCTAIGINE